VLVKLLHVFAAVAACVLGNAGSALAQQEISLSAGFLPDPVTVDLYSGGSTEAYTVGRNCVGTIAASPDVNVYFDSNGGRLAFAVYSDRDTSLVINGPDGRYYCNDDTNGLNPVLIWGSAPSGTYNIWVGAVGDGAPATLVITEGNP